MANILITLCTMTYLQTDAADRPPADITPSDAAKHVGHRVRVELTVRSSRLLTGRDICFLNSERDHRDKKNLPVVIFEEGLRKYRDRKISDPAKHFLKKTIRVTGTVTEFQNRPQIRIDDPKQIEIVTKKTDSATSDRE